MEHVIHLILHVGLDTIKIVPFLFLTYLLLEYIEHKSEERTEQFVLNNKKTGPLVGGLVGLVPQCGFSTAAAGLYSGGIISIGTLLAVFLSTSDEMFAVLFSNRIPLRDILLILAFKFVVAVISGFLLDAFWKKSHSHSEIEHHCHDEGCHCEEKGILLSAIYHTVKIVIFIFIVSVAVHLAVELAGEDNLAKLFSGVPVLSNLIAALIGLIPNCAASVVLAQLYVEGVISAGAMISGLLVGAGTGLLLLLRVNHHRADNVKFVAVLFLVGIVGGLLFEIVGLGALIS